MIVSFLRKEQYSLLYILCYRKNKNIIFPRQIGSTNRLKWNRERGVRRYAMVIEQNKWHQAVFHEDSSLLIGNR